MGKHRTEDYKISAVEYYLEYDVSYAEVCRIFKCSERSLKRWIEKYENTDKVKRNNKKAISYKITKTHVKEAIKLLKQNEQITMEELHKLLKNKFQDFDITPQHLGQVLRDNNITRKRTRHQHFPKTRYGQELDKQKELDKFYKVINKYDIRKIITLDETSVRPTMIKEYGRSPRGKRTIFKTDDNYVYRKFTLLVAINNKKCIGWKLYEKGGMTKERLHKFLQDFVFDKYYDNLIVLDNAGSHNNNLIKDSITRSNNKYLYSIPYTPKTNNTIENYFSIIKNHLKLHNKVLKFDELKKEVENAIKKVKQETYKKLFNYAYRNKYIRELEDNRETKYNVKKNYKD